jgi:hypothetical protein
MLYEDLIVPTPRSVILSTMLMTAVVVRAGDANGRGCMEQSGEVEGRPY